MIANFYGFSSLLLLLTGMIISLLWSQGPKKKENAVVLDCQSLGFDTISFSCLANRPAEKETGLSSQCVRVCLCVVDRFALVQLLRSIARYRHAQLDRRCLRLPINARCSLFYIYIYENEYLLPLLVFCSVFDDCCDPLVLVMCQKTR